MNNRTQSACIYARFSTDRQDARSIDDQVRRCQAFADRQSLVVVKSYADRAQSGATLERAEMKLLLEAAKVRGGPLFQAVLVDDLSRLSRDLGDTWQVVFGDLAAVGVRVVDCSTGMASDTAAARLQFGALALVNDTFLQLVRTETHRGLEGRALAGFWTGGKVYGYRTLQEENPPQPDHPRMRPVVHEAEAAVVRRIFDLYVDGAGYTKIARVLNAEAVPSPSGGTRWGARKGWAPTTIKAMLENPRYVGRFVWNRKKWVRSNQTKKRRHLKRPPEEWVSKEVPDLAIVSIEVWELAQQRLKGLRHAGPGRPVGYSRVPYLLSGLLRCGHCGGAITVVGRAKKNGKSWATFGCSTHRKNGPTVCPNKMCISEKKATETIVEALRDNLLKKGKVDRVVKKFNALLAQGPKVDPSARTLVVVDRDLGGVERRLANITQAIAEMGNSDPLRRQLRVEEQRMEQLRAERKSLEREAEERRPIQVRSEVIEERLTELLDSLQRDPENGRALLGRHLDDITLTPKSEEGRKFYEAEGNFSLDPVVLADHRATNAANEGCGGRI